jgi:hypothetical protein
VKENSEYARLMNRRVEFVLTRQKKPGKGPGADAAMPSSVAPGVRDIPEPPPGIKLVPGTDSPSEDAETEAEAP